MLLLLSEKPTISCTKIDGKSVLRVVVQKKKSIAILYRNHILEIRDVMNIDKISFLEKDIKFTEDDIKNGFPKLYFKDDDLYLLNSDRL